jgi:ABC-type Zn uptake system ZnuABC Zn-binding protein ZnuA
LAVAKVIREKKAGAIFTEPQYPAGTGETLAGETGIPAATLDPAATGPENAGLDYYEKVMKTNLETLKSVLGTK